MVAFPKQNPRSNSKHTRGADPKRLGFQFA
jgi:hypothetical protein